MKLRVISILPVLGCAAATEVCLSCRPVKLQIAPGNEIQSNYEIFYADNIGIGIDLTMAYGTVALAFQNGTILDLGKINGSLDYRLAMKTLAIDASGVRQGNPSMLSGITYDATSSLLTSGRPWESYLRPRPPIELYPIFPLLGSPSLMYKFAAQRVQMLIPFLRPKPQRSADPWILSVTEMLSELKTLVLVVEPLIVHNLVILSYPDFEANTGHIYKDRFLISCQQAGLEELAAISKIASRAALAYYKIEDCYDDVTDPFCDGPPEERINTVLTVTYNEASLGTTLLKRWDGMLIPTSADENYNHGADSVLRSGDQLKYWEEITGFIEEVVRDNHIDHVMVMGSHATERNLLTIVAEILEKHGSGKAWEKHFAGSRNAQEHLFAAARGDAQIGRRGLINGFDACLVPETCEKPEEVFVETIVVDGKSEI